MLTTISLKKQRLDEWNLIDMQLRQAEARLLATVEGDTEEDLYALLSEVKVLGNQANAALQRVYESLGR